MTDVEQNFEMYAGETKEVTFEIRGGVDDELLDLTASQITWLLKLREDSPTHILRKTSPVEGIVILDQGTNRGQFVLTLESDDTKELDARVYYHEAEIVDIGDHPSVTTVGWCTLNPSGIV